MGRYRYGFNGKENDNEVKGTGNEIDYGMRGYDPRAVKFWSVDPLAKKYPELTPYQFASGNPIMNIDVDGLEGFWYYFSHGDPVGAISSLTLDDLNEGAGYINNSIPVSAAINGGFQAVTGRDPVSLQPGASRIDGLGNAVIGSIFHFSAPYAAGAASTGAKLERQAAEDAAATTNKATTGAHGSTEAAESNTANASQSSLQQRAQEIHEKQTSFAQRRTTTAVGEGVTESGEKVRLVASSNARLAPSQRVALKPGEIPINNKSLNLKSRIKVHAEQKVTRYAALNNIKLAAVAPSRPACPSCVISVENSGAKLEGEIKKVPSQQ